MSNTPSLNRPTDHKHGPRVAHILLACAGVALSNASALAQDTYSINSDTGAVTFNNNQVSDINGVPIADLGLVGSIRRIQVRGDLWLLLNQRLEATGTFPLRIIVAGNVWIPPTAQVKASADSASPGPGGGTGAAAPINPGSHGFGGSGGSAVDAPDPGLDGAPGFGFHGGAGGEGGDHATDGGNGGSGNGLGGVPGSRSGLDRTSGGAGSAGSRGGDGIPGQRDALHANAGGLGGPGGSGGASTPAASSLGGHGDGGAGGGLNQSGTPGQSGSVGIPGDDGDEPNEGQPGLGGSNTAPTYILAAGSGGGSGGCGGGGAGGAGGSEGGAGGGGGSGGVTVFPDNERVPGGGGGGGGGAGAGGAGGDGGDGGKGGSGGHGGGALEFFAFGRIDLDSHATFESKGSDGQQGEAGDPGLSRTQGADGGTGGFAGVSITLGGFGGNGARGGDGGNGASGGRGGNGGGGGGGTLSLVSSLLNVAGEIITSGGAPNGSGGRLMYAHNSAAIAVSPFAQLTDVDLTVSASLNTPRSSNIYSNVLSPMLAPAGPLSPTLVDGPAPYGFLPAIVADDDLIVAARRNAPPGALVAFVRYDTGPAPFDADWRMQVSTSNLTRYDLLVAVNLTGNTIQSLRLNGQYLNRFPILSRTDFGGSGLPTLSDSLAPDDLFAVLIPESSGGFFADILSLVPGSTNRAFTLANQNTAYFVGLCGLDITAHPLPAHACPSSTPTFSVEASGGSPLTYRWQANSGAGWFNLADGLVPDLGTLSGSAAATLVVDHPLGSARLRCVVSDPCNSLVSDSAVLSVCAADFDCDGATDLFDYDSFVLAFEAGTPDADFDGDGTVDFFDYDAFVVAFETGC